MSQLLDCLVTYYSSGEDADGLPNRYFCYHVVGGPGVGPDGGVAAIATLATHGSSRAESAFRKFHAVRAGGPETALYKALHYLDAYHATDRLQRTQSEVRRAQAVPAPPPDERRGESSITISAAAVLADLRAGREVTILDVRSQGARNESLYRIRGDVRVLPGTLPDTPPWPKDRLLVAYGAGASDAGSVLLAQELQSLGYTHARALAGGFEAWRAAGGPIDPW